MNRFNSMIAAMKRRHTNKERKPYKHRIADAYEGERNKAYKDGWHKEKPIKLARRMKLLKYWARACGK